MSAKRGVVNGTKVKDEIVVVKEFVSLFEENRRTLVLRFSKSEIQISGSGTSIEQMREISIFVVVV